MDFIIVGMNYCDFNCDVFSSELGCFRSLRGRIYCFKVLFKKIILLPFAVFLKCLGTLFRITAFIAGAIGFITTLGSSNKAQEVLVQRSATLAKDFTDWITFPVVVGTGLFRLLLGSTLTPAVYFQ